MWRVYGRSQEAVRIDSTQARLEMAYRKSSISNAAYLGKVEYREIASDIASVRQPSFVGPWGRTAPALSMIHTELKTSFASSA